MLTKNLTDQYIVKLTIGKEDRILPQNQVILA